MLFLVSGAVRIAHYMSDAKESVQLRLVEAADEDEAKAKFNQHFEKQTREYSVYYSAWAEDIHPVIS